MINAAVVDSLADCRSVARRRHGLARHDHGRSPAAIVATKAVFDTANATVETTVDSQLATTVSDGICEQVA